VSGRVRYAGTGAPMAGVSVALSGAAQGSAETTGSGDYTFANLDGGSYTVRAARLGGAGAAITSADATSALEASVGARALGTVRALACDVTGNGSVSALDAARLMQRVAGQSTPFSVAVACASDWLFVAAPGVPGAVAPVIQSGVCQPAAIQLTIAAPFAGADFDAVAFGDCVP